MMMVADSDFATTDLAIRPVRKTAEKLITEPMRFPPPLIFAGSCSI
jgi:hypothetical protein